MTVSGTFIVLTCGSRGREDVVVPGTGKSRDGAESMTPLILCLALCTYEMLFNAQFNKFPLGLPWVPKITRVRSDLFGGAAS